jgi:hypothetical protein
MFLGGIEMNRSVLIRMISESVLIVLSILLALSADAWLDSRNLASQQDRYLAALTRDFRQMKENVDESFHSANRAVEAGILLSNLLQEPAEIDANLARELLWHLVFYEVFTPSIGAYEALLVSGNIEFLENEELKFELAGFFGSFRDTTASEQLLLDTQITLFASDTFSRLAGWHRMGQGGVPIAGSFPIDQWYYSEEFMNALGILTVRQSDVLADYDFLRLHIQNISEAIAEQISK